METIPGGDSFKASRKVCQMAAMPGLATLIGPLSSSPSDHMQNMADQMKMPLIETRFDYDPDPRPFSINIYPHPKILGSAYADLIKSLGNYIHLTFKGQSGPLLTCCSDFKIVVVCVCRCSVGVEALYRCVACL